MRNFRATPNEIFASFLHNRTLLLTLIKREILSRYRGSVLGILWSFIQPVLMLGIYTFVFSVVFKARWSIDSDSKTEFALVLFAGLIIFNLFAECVSRAPTLISSHTNYVKKVVFPLEILPIVTLGAAFFQMLMSLCVWLIFYSLFFGLPPLTIIYLPIILLPIVLITVGFSWFISSLGVYLRDIGQIIGLIITVLLFMSPIFYPISALPEKYQNILLLNPLTPVIEGMRDILFWGRLPDITTYLIYSVYSILFSFIGFAWFQKTRKGFADVL